MIRRRAGARQGEKGKKRRKGALAGVFALVNRWYRLLCVLCRFPAVKFGSGAVGAHLFLRQSPADLGRGAECQAAVGNLHPLGHQGPGADDAVPADFRTVEHDGAHAHQGIIADGAAVENGPVADGAAPADTDGEARIGVEDAVVLDIGVGADKRPSDSERITAPK